MKYKLIKELPTFNKGDTFELRNGNLCLVETSGEKNHWRDYVVAYKEETLKRFPNILNEWFEEIHDPKSVWNLEIGDEYWLMDEFTASGLSHDVWNNDDSDIMRRNLGLAYISRDEGQRALVRMKARAILEQDTNGFDPDWLNENQVKWYISCIKGYLPSIEQTTTVQRGLIHFESRGDAQCSLDRHPREWLAYFGAED